MQLNVDTLIHEAGRGPDGDQLLPRPPAGPGRRGVLLQAHGARAALRHDMYATFMAKPIAGEPGSAMHVHQSIVDKATGKNIFSNQDGTPSDAFHHYIGGLQRYIPAAMVLVAPYVNSYRRLSRHTAAPINIEWGHDNRTVGIRSPIASPAGAPGGEPCDRCRRQPLRRHGHDAGLRLPGHEEQDQAQARDEGRRLPGPLRAAAQPGRGAGLAAPRDPTCTRCWARSSSPSTPRSRSSSSTSS